jgi:hypothetical protein
MRISCIGILAASTLMAVGCATSMTPAQFNVELPKATASKFYSKPLAGEAISSGNCKLLVDGRKYTAPIGSTTRGDLKNGARGIDEWVKADGGNAYAVKNFEWISVSVGGQYGGYATQLIVYFDTMSCKSARD